MPPSGPSGPSGSSDGGGAWRWNPLARRWVLRGPRRTERPRARQSVRERCPFCPGNELLTPPEVARHGDPWRVRVFANKFAAMHPEPVPTTWHSGLPGPPGSFSPDRLATSEVGYGFCEVVVLSPDHSGDWGHLEDAAASLAAKAVAERISALRSRPHVRSVVAFVNHGSLAGASQEHPHAQLMAVPLVPPEIAAESEATRSGSCVLCEVLGGGPSGPRAEVGADAGGLLLERDGVVALCPFWAEWDDEVLVLPRAHRAVAGSEDLETVRSLGTVLRDVVAALERHRGAGMSYNIVWHSGSDADFHWHLHVRPRRDAHAGFEQGTGLSITGRDPQRTLASLRDLLPATSMPR